MKAYFISGLGADSSAFRNITLPEPFEMIHLEWIRPFPVESLAEYARRLANGIDRSEDFILVGLSFGGMIAMEISKLIRPHKLILISSAATRRELPLLFRLAGRLGAAKWLPYKKLRPSPLFRRAFGPLDNDSSELLDTILKRSDPVFTQWAIGAILGWKNKEKPGYLLQIHGSEDRIFSVPASGPTVVMQGGGHFCVYSHGKVISDLITNNCAC